MASREVRRAEAKKKKKQKEQHEEHREHKTSKKPLIYLFSVILLVVIVVTFVGGGLAGSIGQDPNRLIFGYYKDRPIEFRYGNYFSNQTQILADQVRDQTAESTDITGQMFSIWRQAFERTAVHEGILSTVESSGLMVTDNRLDIRLTEYGPYMENGVFSEAKYLAASKTEKAATRRLFRAELTESQFIEDYFDNQHTSENEVEFIKEMAETERNYRYVYFSFDEYPEEEVLTYGRDNAELFRKIKLSKLTINSSEADAEALHQQIIENPAVFSELAQTQSVDIYRDKGGEMDWMMYYELEPDFPSEESLQDIFDLKLDEVSEIIVTEGAETTSWAIYKVDSLPVNPDFDDEETVNTVRTYMNRYEAGLIEDFLLEQAEKFRSAALDTNFIDASIEHDLVVDITDFFPINYGASFFLKSVRSMTDKNVLSSAMYNEDFFTAAFSMDKDEISEPIILDDYLVVLQMMDERTAPEEELVQLETYYPFIIRQYRDTALRTFFLQSEDLEDNFFPVFQTQILSNS